MTVKKVKQQNRLAIISGASQGIGKELAFGLAADGYNLALIARSKKDLQVVTRQIVARTGRMVLPYFLDITNFDGIGAMVADILKHRQSIEVLCNCAGIYEDGTLELSLVAYQRLFDVNFKGALALMQAVLPLMQKRKQGYVFNIASSAGKIGWAGRGGYVASKFALVGLSESLFHEYAKSGIKITAICPGYVNTKMAKTAGSNLAPSRMIQTADILETVRWLLKLTAATYVQEVALECQAFA